MNTATAIRSLRATAASAFTSQSRTYAKATLVGRIVAAPEKRETAAGKVYFTYPLAINRPPKVDAEGNVQVDESGYPIKETDFYTIFNFKPQAETYLGSLEVGTQLLVETALSTAKKDINGTNVTSTNFQELSHRVLSRPKKE